MDIKLERFKIYKITWVDHFSDDDAWRDDKDWNIPEKAKEFLSVDKGIVNSIGYFIYESEKYYTFAMNKGEEDSSLFMNILKSGIIDIKELHE